MPSIVNGLFSGRSGIGSHGTAIAVIGDNIANSSTIGYKTSRAEFQDLIAGGQTAGKVVGSGSSISSVTSIFEQGTLEFTSRPLDLAVDGNGLFVLSSNAGRFYTRAGNFRVDSAGYIVNQNGYNVMGFSADGSGALQELNVNSVSQQSVATTTVDISGNVDASADILQDPDGAGPLPQIPAVTAAGVAPPAVPPNHTSYAELGDAAAFSTVVDVFDSLGAKHTMTFFFFHTGQQQYVARGYVNSEEVDPSGSFTGEPREVCSIPMGFNPDGSRTTIGSPDITATVAWNNGSSSSSIDITLDPFTQYSSAANISSINQNGKGIGTVGSISIEKNGQIFALLNNGQQAVIGTIGLVNFANPEGLIRTGGTLLQQSPESGEPVIGQAQTGTFGAIQSGSLELSTVDIANEFVKLITLQRGFQANSRIITTINQLLNDIIQLA